MAFLTFRLDLYALFFGVKTVALAFTAFLNTCTIGVEPARKLFFPRCHLRVLRFSFRDTLFTWSFSGFGSPRSGPKPVSRHPSSRLGLLSWVFQRFPSVERHATCPLPPVPDLKRSFPGFGAHLPKWALVPFLSFLPTSTVYSRRCFAGLLRPAADHGVHHVSGHLLTCTVLETAQSDSCLVLQLSLSCRPEGRHIQLVPTGRPRKDPLKCCKNSSSEQNDHVPENNVRSSVDI